MAGAWNCLNETPTAGAERLNYLISLAGFGVLIYLGLIGILWWLQEHVVFQPPRGVPALNIEARRVSYHAADGVELFAYVVGECTSANTVMLAFHGNADIARWFVPWAIEVVRQTSACVMIPEYRGYDGARGRPTYASSALDARAATDYARQSLGADQSRLVYFGHSLGTAIATELARAQSPRSLILQSPFTSARAMAARMFVPGLTLFWSTISRVHFDTVVAVRSLRCPVWVAHGTRDVVIPVRMGREVFNSAAVKGELLIVDGAGHNDVPEVGGDAYWRWLEAATFSTVESSKAAARAETQ